MEEDDNDQGLAAQAATDYSDSHTRMEALLADLRQVNEAARHLFELASTYDEEMDEVLEAVGWYYERINQVLETHLHSYEETPPANLDDFEDSIDSAETSASEYSQVEEDEVEEERGMNLHSSPGSPEIPASRTSEQDPHVAPLDHMAQLSPAHLREVQEYLEVPDPVPVEEILSLAHHLEESAMSTLPNAADDEISVDNTDIPPSEYSEHEPGEQERLIDLEDLEIMLNFEDPTDPAEIAPSEHSENRSASEAFDDGVDLAVDYLNSLSPRRSARIQEWMQYRLAPLQDVLDFARSLCSPSDPFPPNTDIDDDGYLDFRHTLVTYGIHEDSEDESDSQYDADVENNVPIRYSNAPEGCETPVPFQFHEYPNIILSHCQHKFDVSDIRAEGELIKAARERGDEQCMVCYQDWTGCCLNTVPVACEHCGNHICESCRNEIVRGARGRQAGSSCPYCRRSMGSVVPRWVQMESRRNVLRHSLME